MNHASGKASNAVLAKARALYGRRLRAEDYRRLTDCRTMTELANELKALPLYANTLAEVNPTYARRAQLENLLRQSQYERFDSLCRYDRSAGSSVYQYLTLCCEVDELTAALRRMHVPESVIIPCAVVVRFFPTVGEDYRQIRAAMALRGIAEGRGALLLHPMQSLEYVLMPLLMNSNNVAQDLSAAALTKGIGLPGRHTCMTELRLTVWDFLYPALCTLPLVWKAVTLL